MPLLQDAAAPPHGECTGVSAFEAVPADLGAELDRIAVVKGLLARGAGRSGVRDGSARAAAVSSDSNSIVETRSPSAFAQVLNELNPGMAEARSIMRWDVAAYSSS
jgi:hypothetical protein